MSATKAINQLTVIRNLKSFLEEEDYKSEIYIDSSDVIRIIKGFWSLYQGGSYRKEFFHSKRFFVQNLIFANKLHRKVKILAPHQSELLFNLNKNFGTEKSHMTEAQLDRLITDTGTFRGESVSVDIINDGESASIVEDSVESGIPDFKVALSTFGKSWKYRFAVLFNTEDPIIEFDQTKLDEYTDVVKTDIFKRIRRSFEKQRSFKVKTKNTNDRKNLNDSLALALLLEKVERFKVDRSNHLPIFYASDNVFFDVVKDLNLMDRFTIDLNEDYTTNSLRSHDYFIVHSIFS